MSKVFFVDAYENLIIKVNANEKAKQYFCDYFCRDFNNYYDNFNYEINFCGILKEEPNYPFDAQSLQGFLGSKYLVWDYGGKNYSFAQPNQLKGNHLVIRDKNTFDVYIGQDEDEDIIFRVAREIVFRWFTYRGYIPIHSSAAVTKSGKGYVFFGARGGGKTLALYQKVLKQDATPLSNDVTFVKRRQDGGFDIAGCPLKISYENRMLELFNIDGEMSSSVGKCRIFPSKFLEERDNSWKWELKNSEIKFCLCDFDINKPFENITLTESNMKEFRQYLFDKWNMGNIFKLSNFSIEKVINKYNEIKFVKLKGNFLNKQSEIFDKLKENYSFIDDGYSFREANLGTGENFILEGKQKFFVKTFGIESIYEDVENEIKAIEKLSQYNFPVVKYIKNNSGQYITTLGERRIILQDWAKGKNKEKFSFSKEQTLESIRLLARLNKILDGCDFDFRFKDLMTNLGKRKTDTLNLISLFKEKNLKNKKVLRYLEKKVEMFDIFADLDLDINKFTFVNSHGDYNILQILVDENENITSIIDFSRVAKVPAVWEIARAYSMCSPECKYVKINRHNLQDLICEYEKTLPLSDYDKKKMLLLYALQMLSSNFGFTEYIVKGKKEILSFAYWRVNFIKQIMRMYKL